MFEDCDSYYDGDYGDREPLFCGECDDDIDRGRFCKECAEALGTSIFGNEDEGDGLPPGEAPFRDPGGNSALRAGVLKHPCPTCGEPECLTDADKRKGYQCDACADRAEGTGWPRD